MKEYDPSKLLIGFAMTVAAGALLATMDAISKYLTVSFDVVQVLWGRYFFHTAIVFILLARSGSFSFLIPQRPWLQTRRALMLFGATASMYIGLTHIPLADATSIQFFAPVLVTVMAGWFLSEKVGFHRIMASLCGFVGVLIIVQPGFGNFNIYMLFPLACAFMLAGYLLMTRQLVGLDDERSTLFYTTAVGTILLSCLLPFHWSMPTLLEVVLMISQGSLGAFAHFFITRAFNFAPASLLSPFLYSQLLVASLWSVFFFGDDMSVGLIVGATILVSSGLYIWHRERRANSK